MEGLGRTGVLGVSLNQGDDAGNGSDDRANSEANCFAGSVALQPPNEKEVSDSQKDEKGGHDRAGNYLSSWCDLAGNVDE